MNLIPDITTKDIATATKNATKDLTIRFADMMVTAAGVTAALSLNDAIKSLFAEHGIFYKYAQGGPWAAAFLIFLFAVTVAYWRAKLIPPTPTKK